MVEIEYAEPVEAELVETVDLEIIDHTQQLIELMSHKTPEVASIARLCLGAHVDQHPAICDELSTLINKKALPTWLNGYVEMVTTSGHNINDAAKLLGLPNHSTISSYFTNNKLKTIASIITLHNKEATKLELESELMRRIRLGKSDVLLMFALKKLDPSYRDNTQVNVQTNVLNSWDIEI